MASCGFSLASPPMLLRFVSCLLVLFVRAAQCTEIVATNDWQAIGPNDTLPAGLEIRMDMTTGGKWARLPQPSAVEDTNMHHEKHCDEACRERQRLRREAGKFLRGGSHHDHIDDHPPISSPLLSSKTVRFLAIFAFGLAFALPLFAKSEGSPLLHIWKARKVSHKQ